ncbi:MAG: PAS domain S-box protein [Spirochaetota bacterium]
MAWNRSNVGGEERTPTILLVEDQALIALAQEKTLADYGYEVVTVHSGKAAVEAATKGESIDLVLMDIDLGRGMDGTEAASRILESRAVPIVFLTGHSEREMVEKVKGITRYGYVLKSAGEFVLMEAISMAFELSETHRALSRSRDHYESVVRLSGEIVVQHDANGRWEFLNRRAREFWGLSSGEALSKDYRSFIHPDDVPEARAALVRMKEEHAPIWGLVNRQKTPRGWRTVEWNSAPILDESGAYVGHQATGRDVTEREDARRERGLHGLALDAAAGGESAYRLLQTYRESLDRVEEMVAAVDTQQRYTFANASYLSYYGLDEDALVGSHVRDVLGTEAYEGVVRGKLTQCLEGCEVVFEYEREVATLGPRTLHVSYSPIRDGERVIGVSGVFQDVTDVRRTRDELGSQLARSGALEDIARETLSGASTDELLSRVVRRLREHYRDLRVGYSTLDAGSRLRVRHADQPDAMPDITGIVADLTRAPDYLNALRADEPVVVADTSDDDRLRPVANALEAGGTRALLDVPLVHSEGVIGLLCLDSPASRRWSDAEVTTLEEVAHYLTLALKARDAQAELEREHWRLENIIRGTNVGTWEWNVRTGETRFDETWAELAGYELEELEPVSIATWLDLLHPDDGAVSEAALDRHFRGETDYYDVEVRIRHRNGTWVWAHDRGKVTTWNADGTPEWMFGTHSDITARKRADERVRALLREKEMLLSEVHHRVKNNMNTLQALLAMQASDATNPATVEALEDAKARVQSMGVLYDKLHAVGGTTSMSVRTYLEPLVESVLALFPAGSRVRAETQIDETELDTKTLSVIGTMVNELLTNAMKHAYPDSATGTITVRAHRTSDAFVIVVADDGVGMLEAQDGSAGAGSGLNLVRLLVEQLNGTLRVESPGGARFTLELHPEAPA